MRSCRENSSLHQNLGICRGFSGETAKAVGTIRVTLALPTRDFMVLFTVVDAKVCCILGIDFMTEYNVSYDYGHQTLWCHEVNAQYPVEFATVQIVTAKDTIKIPGRTEISSAG